MADPKTIRLTQDALDEVREQLAVAQRMLEEVKIHVADVVVGRYVIHRSDVLLIMKDDGAWRLVDEDLLATCVGMAYDKETGNENG